MELTRVGLLTAEELAYPERVWPRADLPKDVRPPNPGDLPRKPFTLIFTNVRAPQI